MCKPKRPKMQTPQVIYRDPEKDAAEAANKAQGRANAEIAMRRKRRQGQSLYTMGAAGAPSSSGNTLLTMATGLSTTGGA